MNKKTIKLVPLGGLGEIGMNCMVLECEDQAIVIDYGQLFSDLDNFGVDSMVPDPAYLFEIEEKIQGVVLTHGHEDHIGGLAELIKRGFRKPLFASRFTKELILERLSEFDLQKKVTIHEFTIGKPFSVGHFKVNTIPVTHSIVESCSLVIDSPAGRIIHTGDFNVDPRPVIGQAMDFEPFKKLGDEGVLLLLSDSTNAEVEDSLRCESDVAESLFKVISEIEGLAIITLFSSNIGRVREVIGMARKLHRKVCILGRSIDRYLRIAEKCGYIENIDHLLIDPEDIEEYGREKVLIIATGSQAEPRAALKRMCHGDYRALKLQEGDTIVFSSKFIPGNEKAISRMINQLFLLGVNVIYGRKLGIHASGHADRQGLASMIKSVRPKYFIPVHGEYRFLVHHSRLGIECGVPESHTTVISNGDITEVGPNGIRILDRIEETRIMGEIGSRFEGSKRLLKTRRKLAEAGVLVAVGHCRKGSRRLISDPEIILQGMGDEAREEKLMVHARSIFQDVLADYEGEVVPLSEIEEDVRIELRRFLRNHFGKKVTVLPVLIES